MSLEHEVDQAIEKVQAREEAREVEPREGATKAQRDYVGAQAGDYGAAPQPQVEVEQHDQVRAVFLFNRENARLMEALMHLLKQPIRPGSMVPMDPHHMAAINQALASGDLIRFD